MLTDYRLVCNIMRGSTWWLHLAPLGGPFEYSVKNTVIFAVVPQGSFVAVFCGCILVEDRLKYSDRIQQLIHAWNEPEYMILSFLKILHKPSTGTVESLVLRLRTGRIATGS
jgi:hypothetical protein